MANGWTRQWIALPLGRKPTRGRWAAEDPIFQGASRVPNRREQDRHSDRPDRHLKGVIEKLCHFLIISRWLYFTIGIFRHLIHSLPSKTPESRLVLKFLPSRFRYFARTSNVGQNFEVDKVRRDVDESTAPGVETIVRPFKNYVWRVFTIVNGWNDDRTSVHTP